MSSNEIPDIPHTENQNTNLKKKFYLKVIDADEDKIFPVDGHLSIGSQACDINFDSSLVSPKHCSIILKNGVVTLIDQNSQEGTYLGQMKVDPGKEYFLEDGDEISVGKVRMYFVEEMQSQDNETIANYHQSDKQKDNLSEDKTAALDLNAILALEEELLGKSSSSEENKSAELDQKANSIEIDDDKTEVFNDFEEGTQNLQISDEPDLELFEDDSLADEEDILEQTQPDDQESQVEAKIESLAMEKPKSKKKERKLKDKDLEDDDDLEEEPREASSLLLRMMAFTIELLSLSALYNVYSSQPAFQEFTKSGVESIRGITEQFYQLISTQVFKNLLAMDLPPFENLFNSLPVDGQFSFFFTSFFSVFFLYIFLRVTSSLVLGVSLGQFILGMAAEGNHLLKRVLAPLREVIGLITGPFIVFDLPSLFNIRTLKELLSFTKVYTRSAILSTLLTLILLPLAVIGLFVSPLYEGGKEIVPQYLLQIPVEKVGLSKDTTFYKSYALGFAQIKAQEPSLTYYPLFHLNNKDQSDENINVNIKFYDDEGEFFLRSYKNFDFRNLIKIGFGYNILMRNQYSHLSSYAYDAGVSNKNFIEDLKEDKIFTEQFIELTHNALSLSPYNLKDIVLSYGPFYQSLIEFKKEIQRLPGEDFNSVYFQKINKQYFLVYELKKKNIFRLIPIDKASDRIYDFEFKEKTSIKRLAKSLKGFYFSSILYNYDEAKDGDWSYLTLIDVLNKLKAEPNEFQDRELMNVNESLQNLEQKISTEMNLVAESQDMKKIKAAREFIDSLLLVFEMGILKEDPSQNSEQVMEFYQSMIDQSQKLVLSNQ